MVSQPTIAVTAGDPCGVGPEVVIKALTASPLSWRSRLIVIGDLAVFEQTAKRLRRHLPHWKVIRAKEPWPSMARPFTFLDCDQGGHFAPGRSSRHAGKASLAYLECAVALWRAGHIQALVNAPVTKWAIARSAPSFVGQTEYLAAAMGARDVVMMFVSERLRVVLLTRHVPLRHVAQAIDGALLRSTLRLSASALREHFRIRRPTLALCGLNPHAGEASHTGTEEQAIMRPVLRALRNEGILCDGPFAADGFFSQARTYDAVVCAYHDQGLIPFKLLARDRGAQLSIGLPIVRTSPDHGSALDIAGRGMANPGSMRYALHLAVKLAQR